MLDRSSRAEVRNPVLALASAREILALPADQRLLLSRILRDIALDADVRAEKAWLKRKGPMAAYWRATCTYAKHLARAVKKA